MADTKKESSEEKSISALDKLSKKILTTIDSSYSDREILSAKDAKFQSIINRELDLAKGVSGGNVVDFIASLKPDAKSAKQTPLNTNYDDIFSENVEDIFGYFQDIYKNKYLEMSDLKFISKFIPAIGEAVKTTLDSIVSSDDVSSTITRNIILPTSITDADKSQIMDEIKRIENKYQLPKKLKNTVFKKTLVTGSNYVYAISYSELFSQYSALQASGKLNSYFGYGPNVSTLTKKSSGGFNLNNPANESMVYDISDIADKAGSALESFLTAENIDKKVIGSTVSKLKDSMSGIIVDDSEILYGAMEAANSMAKYRAAFPDNEILKDKSYIADGTVDMNRSPNSDFSNINDTYIKYIDSKNIIPVKIFDTTVGYYHILSTSNKKKSSSSGISSLSSSVFNSVNLTEEKKDSAINNIIQIVSDGIMEKFSTKFVEKNAEYKNLIAECIIANGIVDNEYRVQFIPAKYIIPFTINEDENGFGESILADSLFPAKLLLSLIICKMLTYMNKSGNKTIAHVYKGPIDINTTNQLQRVTRMMQESNITFNDLLSTNLVFSKFTRDSNIQLPRGRNGEKLIEFETQEGQNVDMHTDFEDKLEQMAILGTGVPSVIMEYVNQADFAKQIVSANIKFAGRISSLQSDLEESTTALYRALLNNSSLSDELKQKCISTLTYKLPRPRVLANSNNSEFLQNLLSMAQTVTSIYLGESSLNKDDGASIKDEMIKQIVIKNAPFFDWDSVSDIYDTARIAAQQHKVENQKANGDQQDEF